jgi:hypothetical protein
LKTRKTFYIASVELYQVKAFDGSILTKEGELGWLGECEWGPQVFCSKTSAVEFKTKPTSATLKEYDGKPWFCRIKPDTLKVYQVTEEVTKHVHRDEYLL